MNRCVRQSMAKAAFGSPLALFGLLLTAAGSASGQTVIENNRAVAVDTPEAWAMRYFAGTTLLTSFGETPEIPAWHWSIALDMGSIPRLSDAQQRVGFGGFKHEDLNKTPVFGRARLSLGLPERWVVEFGYTPPLEINGARPRNVFALALGRRIVEAEGFTVSMRALGQIGEVRGDITCPASLAGSTDLSVNPYGCQAPSRDTFTTDYYGGDVTLGWTSGNWQAYGSLGIVRANLGVQVDAQLFDANDRSRLTSRSNLRWLTLGSRYAFDRGWSVAAEWLYVPLGVRRPPDLNLDQEPLNSFRLQLRYSFE